MKCGETLTLDGIQYRIISIRGLDVWRYLASITPVFPEHGVLERHKKIGTYFNFDGFDYTLTGYERRFDDINIGMLVIPAKLDPPVECADAEVEQKITEMEI